MGIDHRYTAAMPPFYRFILRIFFGVVIVPEDRIGLATKNFVLIGKQELPESRIIALNGEAGISAMCLNSTTYSA
jgi:hypothetical protein